MTENRKKELCDDVDCHCEDGIDWDWEGASQAAINLAACTARTIGYSSEMTHNDKGSTWTIAITCDPTRKHPELEPKTVEPGSIDEHDLEYGRKNAEKMVENLKRMKVSSYKESHTNEYGTWTIVAHWNGTLLNDPRYPVSPEQTIQ